MRRFTPRGFDPPMVHGPEGDRADACMANVMVVDDEYDIREAVRDILEAEGYSVVSAANGKLALEALEALESPVRPCVVLLDLMMPVMNGWQVLEALKQDPALADIPVVLVTASDRRPEGAAGLIRKPFDIDHLIGEVERHCGPPPA